MVREGDVERDVGTNLDVLKVSRVLERGVVPVQVTHPAVEVGVVLADAAEEEVSETRRQSGKGDARSNVGLEVTDIHAGGTQEIQQTSS
jgi:hypothetical protein